MVSRRVLSNALSQDRKCYTFYRSALNLQKNVNAIDRALQLKFVTGKCITLIAMSTKEFKDMNIKKLS
jgi:hypothetical protein